MGSLLPDYQTAQDVPSFPLRGMQGRAKLVLPSRDPFPPWMAEMVMIAGRQSP
jgi:hypothetical protein